MKKLLFSVLAKNMLQQSEISSREARVQRHKNEFFERYTDQQQAFIDFVFSCYIQEGVEAG